jgi:GDP-D-mannose dehydratase
VEELGVDRHPELRLVEYDLLDLSSSLRLIDKARPDENLQSRGAELRRGFVRPAA